MLLIGLKSLQLTVRGKKEDEEVFVPSLLTTVASTTVSPNYLMQKNHLSISEQSHHNDGEPHTKIVRFSISYFNMKFKKNNDVSFVHLSSGRSISKPGKAARFYL